MPSAHQLLDQIDGITYRLDLAGVIALFGGDYAVSALETIHLYKWRDRFGWYNYPGTMTVARKFGQIARSRFWDSIFPGPNEDPEKAFGLEGKEGPPYIAAISGTKLSKTGHLAYLLSKAAGEKKSYNLKLKLPDGSDARETTPATVTVIRLWEPESEGQGNSDQVVPTRHHRYALLSIIPSLVCLIAFVWCLLAHDALCAMLILLGMINSGVSSLLLGSAKLSFHFPPSSKGAPVGDGFMCPNQKDFIVLRGSERAVAAVTRGSFKLDFPTTFNEGKNYHLIGISSLLLMTHVLVQLLLIPLTTFFGQLLFLASLVASGLYHLYLSSHDSDTVQQQLLLQKLRPMITKVALGTRTQIAVFICLALADGRELQTEGKPDYEKILNAVIPNETEVWKSWRAKVISRLEMWNPAAQQQPFPDLELSSSDDHWPSSCEKKLHKNLIDDAWCVFAGYPQFQAIMPKDEDEEWESDMSCLSSYRHVTGCV